MVKVRFSLSVEWRRWRVTVVESGIEDGNGSREARIVCRGRNPELGFSQMVDSCREVNELWGGSGQE